MSYRVKMNNCTVLFKKLKFLECFLLTQTIFFFKRLFNIWNLVKCAFYKIITLFLAELLE